MSREINFMPEIKNLKKAGQRIKTAIKKREKIVIFSDADLDGATSAVILQETIANLGGRVSLVYFPDREQDGYGLAKETALNLAAFSPGLLIILDCGIGSFEGVEVAGQIGFDVLIIDHHEILDKMPSPALIIDPKQPKDQYAFKKLTTVSIVYKLSELMLNGKMPLLLQKSFMELAALGSIADMMPEEDYNKKVIDAGLACLFSTFRPGLKELISLIKKDGDTTRQVFQKMVVILNITAVKNHLTESYLLFRESDKAKARELAQNLISEAERRQMRIQDIVVEIQQKAEKELHPSKIIFEGSELWEQILTGPVASRICNKFQQPSFIFKIGKEKCRGSVRMPRKMDGVAALKSCSVFLEVFGGHPPAAGFTTSKDKIEKLGECLKKYFS